MGAVFLDKGTTNSWSLYPQYHIFCELSSRVHSPPSILRFGIAMFSPAVFTDFVWTSSAVAFSPGLTLFKVTSIDRRWVANGTSTLASSLPSRLLAPFKHNHFCRQSLLHIWFTGLEPWGGGGGCNWWSWRERHLAIIRGWTSSGVRQWCCVIKGLHLSYSLCRVGNMRNKSW